MTNHKILQLLQSYKVQGRKAFALLIDPDKFEEAQCEALVALGAFVQVDMVLVGGSLMQGLYLSRTIALLRQYCRVPIIIFPGSNMHIDMQADGILLLSLISGRNPDFLIGQHVVAAPILKKSRLEVLPTGYMLIEGGKPTTASYISNTTPIPHDKPDVAVATAMAGELLGLQLIYADTGSGAERTLSRKMVNMLSKNIRLPLIVGGGVRQAHQALELWEAGADVVVIGNAIEENPTLLTEVVAKREALNAKLQTIS